VVWFYRRADIKRAILICAIVGSWLVAFNQGSAILAGGAFPIILYIRIFLDYATPFTVSSVTSIMRNRSDRLIEEKKSKINEKTDMA
jgi:hypothetical protein